MKKRYLAALLCITLLSASFAFGDGLLPSLTTTYGIAMPSLTEALGRYPDSEETVEGATVENWTGITEADFETFGVYLKRKGAALQDYHVEGSVFTATVAKDGRSFTFMFDNDAETAVVNYPEGTYDELLFAVKSVWNAAEASKAAGRYMEAAGKYASLIRYEGVSVCYRDSDQMELQCYYAEGEAKRAAQDWDGAVAAFTKAGSYSDAATQILATRYAEGEAKRDAQDWDEAVAAFTKSGSYSDAATQIKETHYKHATALLQDGKADEALTLFTTIKGYKDVDNLLATDQNLVAEAARLAPYKTIGSYVEFGHYTQTNSMNDSTPIEWLVLDYDAANNRALLISRYGLDAKPYNEKWVDITWEKCTLRTWLNRDFLNAAFSQAEQSAILLTNVDNSKSQGYSKWSTNGGNNTQDRIFLLSYAEANKYLGVTYDNSKNTKSRVSPTAYTLKQGAYTSSGNKTADGSAAGWWWLRSPGSRQGDAAYVLPDGSLLSRDVSYDYAVVRPALWINLESDIL